MMQIRKQCKYAEEKSNQYLCSPGYIVFKVKFLFGVRQSTDRAKKHV